MKYFREKPHLFWFGLAVLILVAESALFASIWTSFADRDRWSNRTHTVIEKIGAFLSEAQDAEAGERGYLLTGQDEYLESYNAAVQAIPARLDELSKLTSDNPRQQSRIENLRPLIAQRLAVLKENIALRRSGGAVQAMAAVSTGQGKQVMDRIRVVVQAMEDGESALLAQRRQREISTGRLLIFVMATGAGLLLIVLLAGSDAIGRAIAARARAEAAEKAQRDLLQVTLASIGDGVVATDPDGRVTLINPVAAQLTGWPPQEAQSQPLETVFPIQNQETGEKVENPALLAIRNGRIAALANHTVLIARDGRRIPVEDSGAPIVDASGKLLGAVLIFRDVSEKMAREAELRRRDRMLRYSLDAIVITDVQRRILSWNRGARELYGWEEAEVRDKLLCDFLHTSPSIAQVDEILRREGQWRGEMSHTRKDGAVITVESRQVLLRDAEGKFDGVLEINRDITERKRAEREMAWLASFPELNVNPIAEVEPSAGVVQYANPAARGLFPDLLQQGLAHPWLAGLEQAAGALPEGDGSRVLREVVVDGLCYAQTIHYVAEKRRLRVYGVDITERKRADERLLQAQKLESVGQLAGGIAHDFNNLLVGVVGSASLAQEMAPPRSPLAELIDTILRTGEQLAYLTRQMLAYSGKGRFFVEPLNLSDLIPEMSRLVQPSIPKKIDLRLELDPRLPPIQADRGQIQQVFMNLVFNSAEAIGSDAGVIDVKTASREVDGRHAADVPPGKYVCLEVRDTGCGMDDSTKARMFEPFFSTKFVGRGLGLAAVSGIVRGHQGAITVASSPGQGAAFTVLFPAAEDAVAASPFAAVKTDLDGSGTVLVVDDEEVVREVARSTLERHGYQVLLADSGLAAIDVFKRHPGEIKLTVLDLSMPGMGGEETLPELRKIRPNVKVVASSGYSEAEMMRMFAGQQVSGFLQKPFTASCLAESVKSALSGD